MAMGAGIGCALVLLGPLLGGVAFGVLEGSAETVASGRDYFDARLWGAPAALTNFAITGWLLGQERSRAVLAIATLSNVLNILLDWWFIFGLGWASAGAGYATAVAQVAGLCLGLVLVWHGALSKRWRQATTGMWAALEVRELMSLNLDITVRTLALVSAFAIFIDFSAVLGTAVLAANALMLKVVGLAAWFIDGFAFSVESLVGRFSAAGDRDQSKRLLTLALGWAIAAGLGVAALFSLFPGPLFGVLTDQPELLALVSADAPFLFGVLGFGSIAYILDGWFLGISAGPTMRNAMLVSLAVGFLPLVLLARAQQSSSLLWAALVLFMLVRVLTLGSKVRF
jgi:MATE family multidrug resistance protein